MGILNLVFIFFCCCIKYHSWAEAVDGLRMLEACKSEAGLRSEAGFWSSLAGALCENLRWFFKWVSWVNPLEHISQEKGFSPVWIN